MNCTTPAGTTVPTAPVPAPVSYTPVAGPTPAPKVKLTKAQKEAQKKKEEEDIFREAELARVTDLQKLINEKKLELVVRTNDLDKANEILNNQSSQIDIIKDQLERYKEYYNDKDIQQQLRALVKPYHKEVLEILYDKAAENTMAPLGYETPDKYVRGALQGELGPAIEEEASRDFIRQLLEKPKKQEMKRLLLD
jgi:hypothetical protein